MLRSTEPVKRICYADDITVWASRIEISELEHKVNTYLMEMSRFLWENSFLISAPKSSVTLFTPDPAQANTRAKIKIDDSELPLVRSSKLQAIIGTLFSFYIIIIIIADMLRSTEPVKRICYADDITVWASRIEISELEHKVNTYLMEMSRFLWENSFLISAPKSSVTLFTPDPTQANTRAKIKIDDSELPLVRSSKLLGVYLDTFFSFNKYCVQVTNSVSKRNNVLKALIGTNWGQQKQTLLMTYKALGRSIENYAAPVRSINASKSNIYKIQRAQNEALRIITGSHKMSSIDHIHSETKMLQVEDHLNLLSAQYLVQYLDTENVCHHITKMDLPQGK